MKYWLYLVSQCLEFFDCEINLIILRIISFDDFFLNDALLHSEPLQLEHREIVVDMISRSFADKGDLTTLANVTYDNISEQVSLLLNL